MSYLIFARKFRPQNFDDVVGQEPIVTTLKNAIRQERIPQNFLFSGPRGVGKTSTARIVAKALNCEKGPAEEPCEKCRSCEEITAGNSMDVLEIDGASNRGIDEIRNLRETVKFKPVAGSFKIYIIDEVHMLTTEAFNALLKTLEEPPTHVKFIFATTESHKVPLTILSRCQRFNFKRISISGTVSKLKEIAEKEKIQYDEKALFMIAKASDGALRDAEGLLDQLVSFADKKIKEEDVLSLLGMASEEIYFSVLTSLKAQDGQALFTLTKDLYENGGDLVQFAKGLHEIFRHLLFLQTAKEPDEFIDLSEEGIEELKKHKGAFTKSELLLGLSMLSQLQVQLRRNMASPKLLVEMVLLKLMHLEGYTSIQEGFSSGPSRGAQAPPAKSFGTQSAAASASYAKPAATPTPQTRVVSQGRTARDPSPSVQDVRRRGGVPQSPPQAQAGEGATAVMTDVALSLDAIGSAWSRVVEYVKTKRMSSGIFLSESAPMEVEGTVVTLGLPEEFKFHKEMLEKDATKRLVEEAFQVALGGVQVRVQFVITQAEIQAPPANEEAAPQDGQEAPKDISQLPEVITEAMNIFDGAKLVKKDP